jgi:hypothetical protein
MYLGANVSFGGVSRLGGFYVIYPLIGGTTSTSRANRVKLDWLWCRTQEGGE